MVASAQSTSTPSRQIFAVGPFPPPCATLSPRSESFNCNEAYGGTAREGELLRVVHHHATSDHDEVGARRPARIGSARKRREIRLLPALERPDEVIEPQRPRAAERREFPHLALAGTIAPREARLPQHVHAIVARHRVRSH